MRNQPNSDACLNDIMAYVSIPLLTRLYGLWTGWKHNIARGGAVEPDAACDGERRKPRAGDVVRVQPSPRYSPVTVVLNGQPRDEDDGFIDESIWTGWIVSPYTAYASHFDVFDVMDDNLGMVHAWNFVTIHVPDNLHLVAEIPEINLTKIRSVFKDYLIGYQPDTGNTEYVYGEDFPRQTREGVAVVTGPPIADPLEDADPDDLRIGFWEIYNTIGNELRKGALEFLNNTVSEKSREIAPEPVNTGLARELKSALTASWEMAPGPGLELALAAADEPGGGSTSTEMKSVQSVPEDARSIPEILRIEGKIIQFIIESEHVYFFIDGSPGLKELKLKIGEDEETFGLTFHEDAPDGSAPHGAYLVDGMAKDKIHEFLKQHESDQNRCTITWG